MKLIRLKITDPKGFRSLQAGFECHFRSECDLQEEESSPRPLPFTTPHFGILRPTVKSAPPFAPFVCAGPNGSGKSNLLEALAAIFYHLECIYLENLPDSFRFEAQENPNGFRSERAIPDGFEIEYLIRPKDATTLRGHGEQAHVQIVKLPGKPPKWSLLNHEESEGTEELIIDRTRARQLLPEYILGYSSGENEILSLPFFKMRFVQFDEYWQALKQQLSYPERPESRLVYLDNAFSQAILLCNLLFQKSDARDPVYQDVGIQDLKEFRIVIRRNITVSAEGAQGFGEKNPALAYDKDTGRYTINLVKSLEADATSAETFDPVVTRLKHCATCSYADDVTNDLYLDYYVNDATRRAFSANFDFEINKSPIALFHAFQVLLTLNLYAASDTLKKDLYQSDSLYVSETVPTLASDERIMRFKNFWISKKDIIEPVLLKSLSDGEHQLLHAVGLCLLFKHTQSLFLLDEPETHFNPDWRANFITRLNESFEGAGDHEMLITTHTAFLISDSKPENVLVFKKDKEGVAVKRPEYNTLGASINKITMTTFDKRETIGGKAQGILDGLRQRFEQGEVSREQLIAEVKQINTQLGDSIEKVLLIKTILDSMEEKD